MNVARTVALGLAVCLTLVVGSARGSTAARAVRVGAGGASVTLPPGWRALPRTKLPLSQPVDPVTRITVASGPVRWGRGCNELDLVFPRTGVASWS